jgi:hypothetical protein
MYRYIALNARNRELEIRLDYKKTKDNYKLEDRFLKKG